MTARKLKPKPQVNYSEVFDQVMLDVDGDMDQALKRIIEEYSPSWEMDTTSANDIIHDKHLTAPAILDCLNVLLEISEQTDDFRRAVFVLVAKVKKQKARLQEQKKQSDHFEDDTSD